MAAIPLFDVLGPDGARDLRRLARRRQFRRREVIVRQGDPGDSVHFIERGHVAVQGEGAFDEPVTLAVLGPGDHFGDLAVLSPDGRRTATVQALDECVTYALPGEHFIELRDRHAGVRRAMTESMARLCRRLVDRLLDARQGDATARLAHQLEKLDDLFGGAIPFTQEDLAAYLGLTRATVNQALARLAAEGRVEVRRGSVRVLGLHREPAGDGG